MLSIYIVLFFSHSSDLFIACLLSQKQWYYPDSQQSSENTAFREHSYSTQIFFAKLSAAGERIIFMH